MQSNNNEILSRTKLRELVSQSYGQGGIDSNVENLLLEIADDFVERVAVGACNLAKHREGDVLEVRDLLLHLETAWDMSIPLVTTQTGQQKRIKLDTEMKERYVDMR